MQPMKLDRAFWRIILKFLLTSFVLVGFVVHELGHILMQAVLGLPFCLSFAWPIGFSTTSGCLDMAALPPLSAAAILLAGLAATLAAYRIDALRGLFLPGGIKRLIDKKNHALFDRYFPALRFLLYLAVCLAFASHDLAAVWGILGGG